MTLSSLRARILALFGITRLWNGRRCWRCACFSVERQGAGECGYHGIQRNPNAEECGTGYEEREFEEE